MSADLNWDSGIVSPLDIFAISYSTLLESNAYISTVKEAVS